METSWVRQVDLAAMPKAPLACLIETNGIGIMKMLAKDVI